MVLIHIIHKSLFTKKYTDILPLSESIWSTTTGLMNPSTIKFFSSSPCPNSVLILVYVKKIQLRLVGCPFWKSHEKQAAAWLSQDNFSFIYKIQLPELSWADIYKVCAYYTGYCVIAKHSPCSSLWKTSLVELKMKYNLVSGKAHIWNSTWVRA